MRTFLSTLLALITGIIIDRITITAQTSTTGLVYMNNGVQQVYPLGRGLYFDGKVIRTLTWGGLYDGRPNVLWMTTGTGGNAHPVLLDPTLFATVNDPNAPGQSMLTLNITTLKQWSLLAPGSSGALTIDPTSTPPSIDLTPGVTPCLACANTFGGLNAFAMLVIPSGDPTTQPPAIQSNAITFDGQYLHIKAGGSWVKFGPGQPE